jgi:hypothetical protein
VRPRGDGGARQARHGQGEGRMHKVRHGLCSRARSGLIDDGVLDARTGIRWQGESGGAGQAEHVAAGLVLVAMAARLEKGGSRGASELVAMARASSTRSCGNCRSRDGVMACVPVQRDVRAGCLGQGVVGRWTRKKRGRAKIVALTSLFHARMWAGAVWVCAATAQAHRRLGKGAARWRRRLGRCALGLRGCEVGRSVGCARKWPRALGRGRGAGPREGRRREPKKEKKGKEEGRAAEQAGWAGAAAGPPREMGERMAGGGFSFYLFIFPFLLFLFENKI